MSNGTPPASRTLIGGDDPKAKYAIIVVIVGICAVAISLLIALAFLRTATTVAAVLAPVTATIGTIVGAFFGISHAGSRQDQTTDAALKLAAAAPPEQALAALGLSPPTPVQSQPRDGDAQATKAWTAP